LSPTIQAIRGMRDILPAETPYWQHIENCLLKVAVAYGYQQIRLPLLEQTGLFERSIGGATDIVENEMYTFADRNGDSLTLRPEGTAGCVRACIEHGLIYNQIQRLWYFGPMFRHERPQKGRYRQFYQFGVEAYGMAGPDIDAEIIFLSAKILASLNLENTVTLQLNSLGSLAARKQYRECLVAYFSSHQQALDEDSRRRLSSNPLRILDSKNPAMQELIANAPLLIESLDAESAEHFASLRQLLDQAGISYAINPRLVRGLDYYGGTVFEWVSNQLGAQSAVCAGGRYDALVELLGGKPTPAIGFALGVERIVALLESRSELTQNLDAYLILMGPEAQAQGVILAEQWRREIPQLRLQVNCSGGNFKSQFKRADKSGARLAFILGPDELSAASISVKFLRQEQPQIIVPFTALKHFWEREIA
jgi:histidyl-tRNA synthetase